MYLVLKIRVIVIVMAVIYNLLLYLKSIVGARPWGFVSSGAAAYGAFCLGEVDALSFAYRRSSYQCSLLHVSPSLSPTLPSSFSLSLSLSLLSFLPLSLSFSICKVIINM